MITNEYKESIIVKLGLANDCEEVKQIIQKSIDSMKEKQLSVSAVNDCLDTLKVGLKALSPSSFDYLYWCNIRCAILYLKALK